MDRCEYLAVDYCTPRFVMSSTTTQRRKGGAPKSVENFKIAVPLDDPPVKAEVMRRKFGTGAFDQNWLNTDCCGLFCALFTYCLHFYGVYAVCLILIPPWMSTLDEDGIRSLTLMGHLHRLLFTLIAALAVYSHFKAMTTDPGAVPPDAMPLSEDPSKDEQNGSEMDALNQPKRGKRLCRRCSSFKPKRAHHCSVCRRCIVKMDRKETLFNHCNPHVDCFSPYTMLFFRTRSLSMG